MAQEQFFNEEDKESVDFQEILFRYLSYWKWIVASVVVFLVGAYVYLKCTVPVYNISSTILLKDDKRGGGVDELSTLQEWGVVSSKNNIDNEIEILKSKNLLKSVVTDLKLYVSYSLNDRIPSVQLYKYSPVVADMDSVGQLVHPVFIIVVSGCKVPQKSFFPQSPVVGISSASPACLPPETSLSIAIFR